MHTGVQRMMNLLCPIAHGHPEGGEVLGCCVKMDFRKENLYECRVKEVEKRITV